MAGETEKLNRYSKIAIHAQCFLQDPPNLDEPVHAREAKQGFIKETLGYLSEVEHGLTSPYFSTDNLKDAAFYENIARERIRLSIEERYKLSKDDSSTTISDSGEVVVTKFAFITSRYMSEVTVPFSNAPGLRTAVTPPRDLAEFADMIQVIKGVTNLAGQKDFWDRVMPQAWRLSYGFWEATKWLVSSFTPDSDTLRNLQS